MRAMDSSSAHIISHFVAHCFTYGVTNSIPDETPHQFSDQRTKQRPLCCTEQSSDLRANRISEYFSD